MGVRRFLVASLAFVLYVFPPSIENWPLWARVGYLLLPVIAWFTLKQIWKEWQPDEAAEDRVKRTVAGGIGGALIVAAIMAARATSYFTCTELVKTRDGQECVGE
jgi:hypothetical protein